MLGDDSTARAGRTFSLIFPLFCGRLAVVAKPHGRRHPLPHPYGLDGPSLAIVARVQSLAEDVLAPHAADVDRRGRFPRESVEALGRAGLLGLCVAGTSGGLGQGPRVFAAVAEELAGACASTAMVFVMHVSAQQAIA